jgi:glucose-1-phosphate cytidylyltransferase
VWYHGNSEPFDFEVTLADTGVDRMTGGRVKRVEQHVKGDTFMVTYGDGLSNVDIKKLLAFMPRTANSPPAQIVPCQS